MDEPSSGLADLEFEGPAELAAAMDEVADLDRKLNRALDDGRGLMVTAQQLELLTIAGALDTWRAAVGEILKFRARLRMSERRADAARSVEARRAVRVGAQRAAEEQADEREALERVRRRLLPPSRREEADAALARGLEMTTPKSRKGDLSKPRR